MSPFDESKVARERSGEFASKPPAHEADVSLTEGPDGPAAPERTAARVADLHVGDPVVTNMYGGRPSKATVSAVGRKYVTVLGHKFDRETGRLTGGYSGHIATIPEHEEGQRRSKIRETLRGFGVSVSSDSKLTSGQLQEMTEIAQRTPDA